MTTTADEDAAKSGSTLSHTVEHLVSIENQHLPDLVIPLREVTWTSNGTIVLPGQAGEARPTDWAKHQLGSLLGVRFDKWFETATPQERAEEMTRRLQRGRGNVRLRLAKGDGGPILRAVVSPSYTGIADSLILGVLANALQGGNARVHRLDTTERMTSVVVSVGEPQRIGGIVGAVWGTITIVNSGVGWRGLSVSLSLLRLICSNGMRAPIFAAQLLKVRHRSLDIASIQGQLGDGLLALPKNLLLATRGLEASIDWKVISVEAEARALLREHGLIRRHLGGVLSAFGEERHATVFGLSQALTLHAQRVEPEERVLLEEVAGSYVARSAP